jgi:ssDNA-binding protein
MKSTDDGRRVTTGVVRLNFPYLFKPRPPMPGQDGEPKYSVMLLIPKTDTKTLAALRAAEKVALEQGKAGMFGANFKQSSLAPSILHDADADGSAEDYPEREGMYYMTVSALTKPQIVDKNLQPVLEREAVYSGVYARVSVQAFPYKMEQMKKGVSFGLGNVQVLGYGESLVGGRNAEDDFDVYELDAESAALL